MNRTRFRASLAACLAAGAIVATLSPEAVLQGAEQQRQGAGQVAQPRDPRPGQVVASPPRVRLTADRLARIADADVRGLDYLPGEVIVQFRPLTTPASRQRALSALRGRPRLADLEWHGSVAVVRDATEPNAHALAQQLMSQPEVLYAEPHYIFRVEPGPKERVQGLRPEDLVPQQLAATPNDTFYAQLQWNFPLLNMPAAWDIQPGATSDIIVAVLDTGVTTAATSMTFRVWTGGAFENVSMPFAVNPDLAPGRIVDPEDLVFLDPGPVLDLHGHGTHVASTIGEDTNNALGLAGLAYNARIMPVKVCVGYWELMIARAQFNMQGFINPNSSTCVSTEVANGIRYAADHGAKVINLSLGGPGAFTAYRDALNYAVSRGAFASISMGNNYQAGNATNYPAFYAQEIMGVMSVAAIGKTLSRAYYSATGAYCEIAAPGGDDSVAGSPDFGRIWQSTLHPDDIDAEILRPRFDRYVLDGYQGTSMAAPHVAGLAALIAAQSPGITPANIERAIRATARDLGTPGKDNEYGYGLIQPRNVLFGWGLRK